MAEEAVQQKEEIIARRVKANLQKAEGAVSNLRKTNTRLLVVGLVSSAGTTLVAGVPAAVGPLIGIENGDWRAICLVAALLGFISAVSMGLNQQLRFGERLSRGMKCVGELKSLDMIITTGRGEREEILDKYEQIVQNYPGFI